MLLFLTVRIRVLLTEIPHTFRISILRIVVACCITKLGLYDIRILNAGEHVLERMSVKLL